MIQAWLRQDGRKGIRNVVAVAYLVECAHHVARRIVDKVDDPDVQLIGFPGCFPNAYAAKVMEAIKFLSDEGTTVVVVEHDLSLIWNICERVHFMAEGQVLLQGEPDEIRKHSTVIEKYLGKGHVAG